VPLPPALRELIESCWAADPAARPANFESIVSILSTALDALVGEQELHDGTRIESSDYAYDSLTPLRNNHRGHSKCFSADSAVKEHRGLRPHSYVL
jgi:hypothetical protein